MRCNRSGPTVAALKCGSWRTTSGQERLRQCQVRTPHLYPTAMISTAPARYLPNGSWGDTVLLDGSWMDDVLLDGSWGDTVPTSQSPTLEVPRSKCHLSHSPPQPPPTNTTPTTHRNNKTTTLNATATTTTTITHNATTLRNSRASGRGL